MRSVIILSAEHVTDDVRKIDQLVMHVSGMPAPFDPVDCPVIIMHPKRVIAERIAMYGLASDEEALAAVIAEHCVRVNDSRVADDQTVTTTNDSKVVRAALDKVAAA